MFNSRKKLKQSKSNQAEISANRSIKIAIDGDDPHQESNLPPFEGKLPNGKLNEGKEKEIKIGIARAIQAKHTFESCSEYPNFTIKLERSIARVLQAYMQPVRKKTQRDHVSISIEINEIKDPQSLFYKKIGEAITKCMQPALEWIRRERSKTEADRMRSNNRRVKREVNEIVDLTHETRVHNDLESACEAAKKELEEVRRSGAGRHKSSLKSTEKEHTQNPEPRAPSLPPTIYGTYNQNTLYQPNNERNLKQHNRDPEEAYSNIPYPRNNYTPSAPVN